MKNLSKIIRISLVALFWTWFFVCLSDIFFIAIWKFDFTSAHSWNIVKGFWERGGNIKTYSDVLLFAALLLLPFLWFIGLRCALKLDYARLLFTPINFLYALFDRTSSNERVVIKATKSTEQQIEEIKNEINSVKPQKNQSTKSIRAAVKEKLSNDS